VLVDCANGAATAEAPELFRLCRIQATFLSCGPDGRNINDNCGALHPETLAKAVASKPGQFDLGITLMGTRTVCFSAMRTGGGQWRRGHSSGGAV